MEKKGQQLKLSDDLKGEEFVVDDLFDFSSGEFEDEYLENFKDEKENKGYPVPLEKTEEEGFGSVLSSEQCIPVDDVANLEWLSHFVEDSFSGYSFPLALKPPEPLKNEVGENLIQATPVQTKVRSKRGRIGFGAWSTTSQLASESPSSCSITSSVSCLITDTLCGFPSPAKRQKKSVASSTFHQARRCNHCGVQKTPQWRAGPMGPKTLCNACGVRYKSGRLLPEYRPACSPTFSSEVHSNNHRKVMEMRRKKEVAGA